MRNSKETIGTETSHLRALSAVPQQTAPPRVLAVISGSRQAQCGVLMEPCAVNQSYCSESQYLGDSFHCSPDNFRQDSTVCFVVVSEYRTVSAFTKYIVLLELNVLIVFRYTQPLQC
jgi:hypothetical protein